MGVVPVFRFNHADCGFMYRGGIQLYWKAAGAGPGDARRRGVCPTNNFSSPWVTSSAVGLRSGADGSTPSAIEPAHETCKAP